MKKFNRKEYFSFPKKERRVAVWIIIVVAAVTFMTVYFQGKGDDDSVTTLFKKELSDSTDNLLSREDSIQEPVLLPDSGTTKQLFAFDPNTLDNAGWKKLGLQDRTIRIINNYRNKGGKFYKPEDIKKIYGITAATADELIPYISIPQIPKKNYQQNNPSEDVAKNPYPKKTYSVININTATEEEWKSLPGIGDVLSKRIVKFRNAQGGFAAIDDVAKTYGLQDSVFQKIRPYLKTEE